MKKRTESEMLDLILLVAEDLETVRAVVLQGSRANPNVPADDWQDFDIVFLVNDPEPLIADQHWIEQFGERIIMQMPESMDLPVPAGNGHFSFLMLFTDGNRIDLTLIPIKEWEDQPPDSLSVLLLDKDKRLMPFPPPGEQDYYPRQPTQKTFQDCCNEFWWTSTYIAKGLQRAEVTYAKAMQETVVRKMLDQMIRWYIGTLHGFAVNPGKYGKYYRLYLSPVQWQQLLQTYSDATILNSWIALLQMVSLFEQLAVIVAREFGFNYNSREAQNVKHYLKQQFPNGLSDDIVQ